jgi:hypothetical protein
MRRAAKVDANQNEVVEALRFIGAHVVLLHAIGGGVPDLLVDYERSFLIEIKDGRKPPSARKLTPDQIEFHASWPGELHTVCSAQEAVDVCLRRPKNNAHSSKES